MPEPEPVLEHHQPDPWEKDSARFELEYKIFIQDDALVYGVSGQIYIDLNVLIHTKHMVRIFVMSDHWPINIITVTIIDKWRQAFVETRSNVDKFT